MIKKKKVNLVQLVIIVILVSIGGVITQKIFSKDQINDQLRSYVIESNKLLPVIVEEGLARMDEIILIDEKKIQFRITLIETGLKELDRSLFLEGAKEGILLEVDNHEVLNKFRENKVTIAYKYYDKYNEPIGVIEIEPSD